MKIFDGKTSVKILQADKPSQVFLQNRSAADVFIYSDQSTLDSSTNPGTGIPTDGFQIPFGGGIITLERFSGELWGKSAVAGAALIVTVNPSDVPCC